MITFSLQSGSNGNCIYVEAGGVRLLIDAGISAKQANLRLAEHGRRLSQIDALLISHDHSDHVNGAGVYQRRHDIPIYLTRPTFTAVRRHLGDVRDVRFFVAGETLSFGDVRVHTLATPHDAVNGVVFVVEHRDRRLGVFTDVGHAFPGLRDAIANVDAAYVESNYDPWMLENGPYPEYLRHRIRGPGGHLSNDEAAELIASCGRRMRWAALAHLSEENNSPEVALRTHGNVLGKRLSVSVMSRRHVSSLMRI